MTMDWSSFSLGNAAGFIKGPGKQFDDMLRSAATQVTIGSITLLERAGNAGNVYQLMEDGTSVNALGLPNPGLLETLKHAGEMRARAHEAKKTIRWSIAGFQPDEYGELAKRLASFGEIEGNLGCPNVWSDSGQKPIAAFDIDVMEAVINHMRGALPRNCPFDLKLSPYSDPNQLKAVAEMLAFFKPRAIITSNTFPNGIANIDTPGGYGGIGGNAMHVIALGQVAQFADALKGTGIKVVGVGGVNSGPRLIAMKKAGADAVQVGTAFGEQGARIFSDMLQEV
jgi:dihydroorotate dehydrogenase